MALAIDRGNRGKGVSEGRVSRGTPQLVPTIRAIDRYVDR